MQKYESTSTNLIVMGSNNCGCGSSLPTSLNLEKLSQLESKGIKKITNLIGGRLKNPAGTAVVQDGVFGISFQVDENRVISIFDDGTEDGITLDATYKPDNNTITLQRLQAVLTNNPTSIATFDLLETVSGSFLRPQSPNGGGILDTEDCVNCILDKCGDCAGCASLIPAWPATLTCLAACAGSCIVRKCWRKCT
jgi:hypothetical protein